MSEKYSTYDSMNEHEVALSRACFTNFRIIQGKTGKTKSGNGLDEAQAFLVKPQRTRSNDLCNGTFGLCTQAGETLNAIRPSRFCKMAFSSSYVIRVRKLPLLRERKISAALLWLA